MMQVLLYLIMQLFVILTSDVSSHLKNVSRILFSFPTSSLYKLAFQKEYVEWITILLNYALF